MQQSQYTLRRFQNKRSTFTTELSDNHIKVTASSITNSNPREEEISKYHNDPGYRTRLRRILYQVRSVRDKLTSEQIRQQEDRFANLENIIADTTSQILSQDQIPSIEAPSNSGRMHRLTCSPTTNLELFKQIDGQIAGNRPLISTDVYTNTWNNNKGILLINQNSELQTNIDYIKQFDEPESANSGGFDISAAKDEKGNKYLAVHFSYTPHNSPTNTYHPASSTISGGLYITLSRENKVVNYATDLGNSMGGIVIDKAANMLSVFDPKNLEKPLPLEVIDPNANEDYMLIHSKGGVGIFLTQHGIDRLIKVRDKHKAGTSEWKKFQTLLQKITTRQRNIR